MSDLSRLEQSASESATFSSLPAPSSADISSELSPPLREGLPPSYRMRADAHYVDQLAAPTSQPVHLIAIDTIDSGADTPDTPIRALVDSIRRHGVLEPLLVQQRDRRHRLLAGRKRLAAAVAAGLREVPCVLHRVNDDEARLLASAASLPVPVATEPAASHMVPAALSDVADSMTALIGCTELLSDGTPQLARTVAVDMIRSEVQRTICTLTAAKVLTSGVPERRRFVAPREIVQRVVDIVAAEARLRGISVDASVSADQGITLIVDPDLLARGLAGVVLTMSAALRGVTGACLAVTATSQTDGRVTLAVSLGAAIVPQKWIALPAESALDPHDAPGLMPLLALRRIADVYGGQLLVGRLPRGSRVSVEIPWENSPAEA